MEWQPARLVKAREEKGLSQGRLARLLKVSQPAVSAWESGESEPSGKHLVRLAQVLGKPERYFYGLDDETGGSETVGHHEGRASEGQESLPVAAMPEPTTPDWNPPPAEGSAPTIEEILREIRDLKRRMDDLERGMGGKGRK